MLLLFATNPFLSGFSTHVGLMQSSNRDIFGYGAIAFGQFGVSVWKNAYSERKYPTFSFDFTSLNVGDTTELGRTVSFSMAFGANIDFETMRLTPYIGGFLHFLPSEKIALTFTAHYCWGTLPEKPKGFAYGLGITIFAQPKEHSLRRARERQRRSREEQALALVEKSYKLIQELQLDSAITLLEKAIVLAPDLQIAHYRLAQAHFYKGVIYAKNGKTDSAYIELSVAMSEDSTVEGLREWFDAIKQDMATQYYTQGIEALEREDYAVAIENFKAVLTIDTNFIYDMHELIARSYFLMGMELLRQDNPDSAVNCFDESAKWDSIYVKTYSDSIAQAYFRSGMELLEAGKVESGIERLEHAVELNPKLKAKAKTALSDAYYDMGFAAADKGNDVGAHLLWAMGHFYAGDRDGTVSELRKFYDLAMESPIEARPYLPHLLRLARSNDEVIRSVALSAIEWIAKSFPTDVWTSLDEIAQYLDAPDKPSRFEAAMIISWVAKSAPDVVRKFAPKLIDRLDDEDADVRFAALSALSSIARQYPDDVRPALPKVRALASDPDEFVRREANSLIHLLSASEK